MKEFIVTAYGSCTRTIVVEAEDEAGVQAAIRKAVQEGEDWDYDFDEEHREVDLA